MQFRVCLFWVKMISGNHFPPNPHVWLQGKMKFSGNSFLVDQYLLLWPGLHFTLLFSVQIISRKREREREREKREPRSERERERGRRESRRSTSGAIVQRARPSSIAIASALVDRAPRWLRSSIAPLVGWSHRSRLRSRNERAPHRSRLRARSSIAPLDDCDRRSRRSSDDHTDLASDLASPVRSHLLLCCAISIWSD